MLDIFAKHLSVSVTWVVLATAPLAAQSERVPVRDGRDVLRLMHTAYAGRWYESLAFVQKTTFVRPGGVRDTATWFESLKGPNLLRIDLGAPAAGRGWMLTAESSYTFRAGRLESSSPHGNVFLPLIMGVYLQPPEATARGAELHGFDLAKMYSTGWEGRAVHVVGAVSATDTTSPQFWVEAERLVVLRMLIPGAPGGPPLDIRLDGYVRVAEGWLATKITISRDGAPIQLEEYTAWSTAVAIPESLFNRGRWVTGGHWAGTTRTTPPWEHPEDLAAMDSAAVARAAWGRGMAAWRARDTALASREVTRAATAWPTQPAYLWGRAVMAARVADSTALRQALQDYAGLGLGRDLRADTTIARFLGRPDFAPILAAHQRHRESFARSRVRATLADSTFWPEAMDHDPRTGHLYVTSIRHRTIAEYAAVGRVRELWPRDRPGFGAMLGVRVDGRRGVLWATTSGMAQMAGYQPADSAIAALLRIRISDGTIERRWDLPPVPGGHVLGDLAVGPAGDVYLTDSQEPVLYRLRPGSDTLERITHPLFRSLQGLAPAPDGQVLYLADYSHGLLRLDLVTSAVTRLPDPPGVTSLGCDGIVWYQGTIVAVQNGVAPARIMRFSLDATGTRIAGAEVIDRNLAVADEPTIGAIIGDDFVYVANSQWEKYGEDGRRRSGTVLTRPVLLAVPLQ